MKIILCMVLSADGKSTKWDLENQSWASSEDQTHLFKLIARNNLIVMGGNTYQVAKNHIKLQKDKLRVVVTRYPEKFAQDQIGGQLEFISTDIQSLVKDLEIRGYKQMLLLSGENLNKLFFENNLIDEVFFTVEPRLFGEGKGVLETKVDIPLKLLDFEKLNEQGTLTLHYQVIKK